MLVDVQITDICIVNSDCSSVTSNDTSNKKQQNYYQQNMGNAFVYAEGYFRELQAGEETLIKHLCRSGSDPAFAATREKTEAVEKKIPARQLDVAT